MQHVNTMWESICRYCISLFTITVLYGNNYHHSTVLALSCDGNKYASGFWCVEFNCATLITVLPAIVVLCESIWTSKLLVIIISNISYIEVCHPILSCNMLPAEFSKIWTVSEYILVQSCVLINADRTYKKHAARFLHRIVPNVITPCSMCLCGVLPNALVGCVISTHPLSSQYCRFGIPIQNIERSPFHPRSPVMLYQGLFALLHIFKASSMLPNVVLIILQHYR